MTDGLRNCSVVLKFSHYISVFNHNYISIWVYVVNINYSQIQLILYNNIFFHLHIHTLYFTTLPLVSFTPFRLLTSLRAVH